MTFRQVLSVIWGRRWTVVATTLLVVLFAAAYLHRQVPTYSSSAQLRLSSAASASALGQDSAYDAITLDLDPTSVTSDAVLGAAAKALHEGSLAGAVTEQSIQGTRTTTIVITATGLSPAEAQRRADAVAAAYQSYLKQQVQAGHKRLADREAQAAAAVTTLQSTAAHSPKNQVVATNLAEAISTLSSALGQLHSLEDAGDPSYLLSHAAPGAPLGTPPRLVLAVAVVSGLLAGIGIALLRDQFDDRVRDQRDLEQLLDRPVLGELARESRRRWWRRTRKTVPGLEPPTPLSEGVRALRTSLQVLTRSSQAVLAVTSPEPGDGKTFVAAHLARSWARAGKRVILVSGDLRRPTLESCFDCETSVAGFSDLIRSVNGSGRRTAAPASDLLQETDEPNLRILAAGRSTSDPADLLATGGVERVIRQLRDLADIVLIDTPPAYAFADAGILGEHADGVVLVAVQRRSKRVPTLQTMRTLQAQGALVVGSVLNMSRRRLPRAYRSYAAPAPQVLHAIPGRRETSEGTTTPMDASAKGLLS